MNIQTIKAIAAIKHLNQSDLARAAGVTRQRASQWLNEDHPDGLINIQTKHLLALAKALDVDVNTLIRPLPLLSDKSALQKETTKLLWDKLYPDLTSLLVAALEKKREALARIVHVYGLYASEKLLGACIWRDFPKYKHFIHPVRRTELEHLWQYRQAQKKLAKPLERQLPRASIAPLLKAINKLK